MQSIRRSTLVIVATVLAVLTGSSPAFAGPAPLIEPEPAGTGGTTSSSSGLFDGWVQVGLAVVVAAAVVVVLASVVSRIRHHQPSAA
jgi:hypothetical protein